MGRKKLPLCEESNGKAATAVASKHSIDDSNSSVKQLHTLEYVSGGKCDCHSAKKAKFRSQIWVCLIMDLDDEESLGAATLNKSMETSVSHSEQAEIIAEVD